jgi:hypothetical protein
MNRLFKKLARSLWRISVPLSRPVVRKFDQHMIRLLGSVSPRVETPANLDLTLNSVVRELARLQIQVESLQEQVADLKPIDQEGSRRESRLSVLGETG